MGTIIVQKADWIIIWLSVQIFAMSILWMRAEKQLSYLQGQQHIFDIQSEREDGSQ